MKAFITGVSGQDGHYLSEFLLGKGYEVFGLVRRSSQSRNIPDIKIIEGDITDPLIIGKIVSCKPDEIYHLAAMSHVRHSFEMPYSTFMINACGTMIALEAAKKLDCKFYNASTSELFGNTFPPQNEKTSFRPRSPYGISKLSAYWSTVNYREAYNLFMCNGILFNHESPIRGEDFITRKVCKAVARIRSGVQESLTLGNIHAKRDWGHAKDYVKAMWLMLQQEKPDDYVVATGIQHSVEELCDYAFSLVDLHYTDYMFEDRDYIRPCDVDSLCGDSSKIRSLGWKPEYSFESLIKEMLNAELASVGLPDVGTGRNRSYSGSSEIRSLHNGRENLSI